MVYFCLYLHIAPEGDAVLSLSSAGLGHRINWIQYQRRTGRQYRHKDCEIVESEILRSRLVYMPVMQAGTTPPITICSRSSELMRVVFLSQLDVRYPFEDINASTSAVLPLAPHFAIVY